MTSTPEPEDIAAPYWRGAAEGVLVLQRCGNCGVVRHYPRAICSACQSQLVEPQQADGRGTVHSWTVTHHAFDPRLADDLPYTLVTVDMREGVRVLGRLDGDTAPAIDLPVRITFAPGLDGTPVPHFEVETS
ncbi:hypothetical protein F1C76_22060 [Geodermatophilaceae bacterium NBWT11]|nr:hypothetical protein F1C76_22060 [Geodermatophilaceae bacterium NBWT11]